MTSDMGKRENRRKLSNKKWQMDLRRKMEDGRGCMRMHVDRKPRTQNIIAYFGLGVARI